MQDRPKRNGRFIKKGSPVFDKVSLLDFKFQEMNDSQIITPDNARRSIILADFHDKETLEKSLKKHDRMDKELIPAENRRPILAPSDFTADWERERSLRKRKITRFDDDDDYDFEMESFQRSENLSEKSDAPKDPFPQNDSAFRSSESTPSPNAWETMDTVGKAIKNLNTNEHSNGINLSKNAIIDEHKEDNAPSIDIHTEAISAEKTITTTGFVGEFTPVSPAHEEAALRNYQKQQQELEKLKQEFETHLSEVLEREKARAYQDGFKLGEEKAEHQSRERTLELFKSVKDLVHDLTQLKFSILSNVQDNFYTICQAIGEALIKREFSINPETFVEVLRRAMAETIQPTNLKIYIHPSMYEKVIALDIPDINPYLSKDSSLDTAGFRLESHLSVIDGSISEMISKMLKQADLDIFEKSTEKDLKSA